MEDRLKYTNTTRNNSEDYYIPTSPYYTVAHGNHVPHYHQQQQHKVSIKCGKYTFFPCKKIQGSKLIRGQVQSSAGGPPHAVSAKMIRSESMQTFLAREGTVLHVLHNKPHPCLPKLRDTVESENYSFVVMDDFKMDLNTYVQLNGYVPEAKALHIFKQLISAVDHCHRNCVVLRRLKLRNIFFVAPRRCSVVISDLEGSVPIHSQAQASTASSSSCFSSPSRGFTRTAVDIYNVGAILFTLLTGVKVEERYGGKLLEKMQSSRMDGFPQELSESTRDLVCQLLDKDPRTRPTARNVLLHPAIHNTLESAFTTLCTESSSPTTSCNPHHIRKRSSLQRVYRLSPIHDTEDQTVPDIRCSDNEDINDSNNDTNNNNSIENSGTSSKTTTSNDKKKTNDYTRLNINDSIHINDNIINSNYAKNEICSFTYNVSNHSISNHSSCSSIVDGNSATNATNTATTTAVSAKSIPTRRSKRKQSDDETNAVSYPNSDLRTIIADAVPGRLSRRSSFDLTCTSQVDISSIASSLCDDEDHQALGRPMYKRQRTLLAGPDAGVAASQQEVYLKCIALMEELKRDSETCPPIPFEHFALVQ